jgi:hypothetical protein
MNTLYYNEQPIFDSEARREMMWSDMNF